jgi:hypothetical protein
MRYSDIPRYCILQIVSNSTRACNLWFGCSYQCNSKQNKGLLNQDHKFWNKSLARPRVAFRICQGTKRRCSQKKTSCLAQRWRSLQRPGMWQEQCDSSSPVSGWGPSNSNKIELFRRKRRTSQERVNPFWHWTNYMINIPSSSNTTSALQRMPMMIVPMLQHAPYWFRVLGWRGKKHVVQHCMFRSICRDSTWRTIYVHVYVCHIARG